LLVYQTATTNLELPAILKRTNVQCRVYGLRRDLTEDQVDENLTYRPFDEMRFIDDLRTARGVIAGGGFTLMSEAVHLRKPMLAIPLAGQFEQTLNALYLQQLGYGAHAARLTDEALGAFLERQSGYRESLQSYRPEGNEKFLAALEEQLAAAVES
jgi:uncharacterized protein (TIGR00661 family)